MDATDGQRRSLWVDVTTLVGWRGQATGIARTLSRVVHHWLADDRLPVRLCRYDAIRRLYQPVTAAEVLPPRQAGPATSEPTPAGATGPWRGGQRLPGDVREACWHLGQAARYTGRVGRAMVRRATRLGQRTLAKLGRPLPGAHFLPGDLLFLGGASWQDSPGADVLAALRAAYDLQIANVVYDITPLRHPHLCDPNLTRAVAGWLPGVVANSDLVLTISEHSRRDLVDYGRREALDLPPVEVIRLGDEPGDDDGETPPSELLTRAPGPFVLFVSTVGLNKNQQMLIHVWRRLVDRHGGGVPTLVLAGQPGWRAETILRELHADASLSRHVIHLARANDRQLRYLYRRCLFTLYPSHYEGWGLPVAESLVQGKYCISSNAASLPEVGGSLVDYHDPLDGPGCLRLVEKALLEPSWLASREDRIRREYRPTTWRECAARLYGLLAATLAPRVQRREAA